MHYIELIFAIPYELVGTNLMKLSAVFTKISFSAGTLGAYALCFYFLSLSLRGITLNVAYATWSGAGIVLATLLSYLVYHEETSGTQLFGIVLIVIGVILANLAGDH